MIGGLRTGNREVAQATMPDVFDHPPVLRTRCLPLRQITETDGEGLFGIFADDQVTEHYAWDAFTSVGQGHELAARAAGQFRQRAAIRCGLLLPASCFSADHRHLRIHPLGTFRDVQMFGLTRDDWAMAAQTKDPHAR
jgi:hypothetical protein